MNLEQFLERCILRAQALAERKNWRAVPNDMWPVVPLVIDKEQRMLLERGPVANVSL